MLLKEKILKISKSCKDFFISFNKKTYNFFNFSKNTAINLTICLTVLVIIFLAGSLYSNFNQEKIRNGRVAGVSETYSETSPIIQYADDSWRSLKDIYSRLMDFIIPDSLKNKYVKYLSNDQTDNQPQVNDTVNQANNTIDNNQTNPQPPQVVERIITQPQIIQQNSTKVVSAPTPKNLSIIGDTTVGGSLNVSGQTKLKDKLTVSGASEFLGDAVFNSALTVKDLIVTGSIKLNGVTITDGSLITGTQIINNNTYVTGTFAAGHTEVPSLGSTGPVGTQSLSAGEGGLTVAGDTSLNGEHVLIAGIVDLNNLLDIDQNGTALTVGDGSNDTFSVNTSDDIVTITGSLNHSGISQFNGDMDLNGALDLDVASTSALTIGDGTINNLTIDTINDILNFGNSSTTDQINFNAKQLALNSASSNTALSVVQDGSGDIINLFDGSNEVFTVLDGGNVGIGTTSPGYKLTVNGDIFSEQEYGSGASTPTINSDASYESLFFWYPKKGAFRAGTWDSAISDASIGEGSIALGYGNIASGGYSIALGGGNTASGNYSVALGDYNTASGPNALATGLLTTASGYNSASLGEATAAQSYDSVAIGRYNIGGGTANSWVSTDSLFEIGIGSSAGSRANALTVLKNGNIGIGTSSPLSKLSIQGTTGSDILNIASSTGASLMYINSTGNIGIGTTTPRTIFHIAGTDGLVIPVGTTAQRPTPTTGTIRYNSETSQFEGYGNISWGSLGGVIDVDQDTKITAEDSAGADNDQLKFSTAGSERMRIDSNGNVGIGTTTPYSLFSISNSASTAVNTPLFTIASTTAGTSTSTLMTVLANGFIGIGTTNPNNLIQVANLINFDNTDYNTSLGYQAGLYQVVGAQYNTFIGYQAGYASSTASTNVADYNTAVGYQSLYSNTTGYDNLAIGSEALRSNTIGNGNLAIGYRALYANKENTGNTAVGTRALEDNLSFSNAAFGYEVLMQNTSGNGNIAVGNQTLYTNTSGNNNSALGYQALTNSNSSYNSAVGHSALHNTSRGPGNSALGYYSGYYNTTGGSLTLIGAFAGQGASSYNASALTAVGTYSLYNIGTGADYNTALGYRSGYNVTTGANNVLLGFQAGESLTTGSNNIVIGYNIDTPAVDSANTLNIGNLLFGTGLDGSNTTLSTGNIGIGTSSPLTKLSVQATAGSDILNIASSTGTSLMYINAAGNVGIGTTSPFTKLSVIGDAYIAGNLTATGTITSSGLLVSGDILPSANLTYNIGTSTYRWNEGWFGTLNIGTSTWSIKNSDDGRLSIFDSASGAGNERISILTNGNVGIGTSSPYAKLSIENTLGGSTPLFIIASSTAGVATSTYLMVTNNGNVGIGAANPTAKFYVTTPTGNAGQDIFRFDNSFGNNASMYMTWDGTVHMTGGLSISTITANKIDMGTFAEINNSSPNGTGLNLFGWTGINLRTTMGTALTIDDSAIPNTAIAGRLGVGTTSPYSMLSISNSVSTAVNTPLFTIASTTAGTSTSTLMTVLANGNVGIGTANAQNLLTLQKSGSASTQEDIVFMGELSNGPGTIYNSGRIYSTFDSNNYQSARITLATPTGTNTFTDTLTVKNTNVGIGITTPLNKLTVATSGNSFAAHIGGDITQNQWTGLMLGYLGTGGGANYSKAGIAFKRTDNTRGRGDMYILNDNADDNNNVDITDVVTTFQAGGNVGIGTTSPFTKLSVIGDAYIAGNLTATGTITSSGLLVSGDILPSANLTYNIGTSTYRWNEGWFGTLNIGTSTWSIKNSDDGRLSIFDSASGAGNERISILTNGNVGIGTSSPYAKLSIENTLGGSTPLFIIASSTAGVATSTYLMVTNNGNVGIGAANPTAKFYVTTPTGNAGQDIFRFDNSFGNNASMYMTWDGTVHMTGGLSISTITANKIDMGTFAEINNSSPNGTGLNLFGWTGINLRTTMGTALTIDDSAIPNTAIAGRLGVGTTSPYSMLSISNSVSTAVNTPLFTIASTTAGTSTSTLMTVLANGNVGIGTANAQNLLTLQKSGSASTQEDIVFMGELSNGPGTIYNSGRIYSTFDSNNYQSARITLATPTGTNTFTDTLTVKNTNVGIGITTPLNKLTVATSGNSFAAHIGGDITQNQWTGLMLGYLGTGGGANYSKAGIAFKRTDNTRGRGDMYILNDNADDNNNVDITDVVTTFQAGGNVGIGTTSPQALLTVGSSTPVYLLAGDKYNSAYISGLLEVGGTGTSTIASNLDVLGTLHATNSYVGDLIFANNFRFTEAASGITPQALFLQNQNGENIMSFDENGSIIIGKDSVSEPGQEPEVKIVELTEITASSTKTAFIVNQSGSGDIADFQANGVSIMNIAQSGEVKVAGSMLVDGRIMLCAGGYCSNALDSAVDETMADLGVEGKVVAGAFEGYCEDGFVWVPGSAKYGTLPGFCVQADLMKDELDQIKTNISQGEAQIACQTLGTGYHLIGENEWLTIAENILQNPDNDSDTNIAGMQLATTSISYKLNNDNLINNLVGEVGEWTNKNVTVAGLPVTPLADNWFEYSDVSDYKGLDIAPDYYLTDVDNNIGKIYVGSTSGLKAFVRGSTGIYGLDLSHSPSEQSTNIGFRCAK